MRCMPSCRTQAHRQHQLNSQLHLRSLLLCALEFNRYCIWKVIGLILQVALLHCIGPASPWERHENFQ